MQILILAATEKEVAPFRQAMPDANILIAGVGTASTIYQLVKFIQTNEISYVIQAGLGGSFAQNLKLGDVVAIRKDAFAQSGVWEENQLFTLKEKGIDESFMSLENENPGLKDFGLPIADAVTVDLIHDQTVLKALIENKHQATVESMEGAALHFVCLQEGIPFLQLRAISNYVGDRNKSNWKIDTAIVHLNKELLRIYSQLT